MKNSILVFILIAVGILTSSSNIDLDNLFNYESQSIPSYISKDNTGLNSISDEAASLGRVLFYDKKLSINSTIACASCHKQEFAFSDTAKASSGVAGSTGRHSMRLVNSRFADESRFFWDERAATLEDQTTMPIQDHIEMGFSGSNGDPAIDSLISRLSSVDYYQALFTLAFGNEEVTEEKMQLALSQFIRSIQSFDSRFDAGMAATNNIVLPFPNYSQLENQGKALYLAPPQFNANGVRTGGGAGCQVCHRAPEFDIVPNSGNNGNIGTIDNSGSDFTITKAPTLRDLFNPAGILNGPLMHDGRFTTIQGAIIHYDNLPPQIGNNNLDNRLRPGGNLQNLNLTTDERTQLEAFIRTLTGADVYTNEKWSDPFDSTGSLTILGSPTFISNIPEKELEIYPVPFTDLLNIKWNNTGQTVQLLNIKGEILQRHTTTGSILRLSAWDYPAGVYFVVIIDQNGQVVMQEKVVKL